MKKEKILYLILFFIYTLFFLTPVISPAQEYGDENLGKLRGWIVDPETGDHVTEVFEVEFWAADHFGPFDVGRIHSVNSDQNGYFETFLPTASYIVRFNAMSPNSRYCRFEPDPNINNSFRYLVTIEKNKTTEIRKIATFGGSLKILIEDSRGNLINFKEKFPLAQPNVRAKIKSPNFSSGIILYEGSANKTESGEIAGSSIFPDIYTLEFSFRGFGYPKIIREGINIEKNKASITRITFDTENITGIEGKICDKSGIPQKDCVIFFSSNTDQKMLPIRIITKGDGKYFVMGMSPGIYEMSLHVARMLPYSTNVEIIANKVIRKDFALDFSDPK